MNQPSDNQTDVQAATPVQVEAEPLTGWRACYDFVMQAYCWFLILFILYVLSVGPLYSEWQAAIQLGERPILQRVYLPLAGLCSEFETVNTVVEWYVGFWQS